MYAGLTAHGAAAASVHKTHQVRHAALEAAVDEGLIPRNPASRTSRPRIRRRAVALWDSEQLALFLGRAKREALVLSALFTAAMATGLRQGELLGLRWQDVDWAAGAAHVRQRFYRLGSVWLFGPPKTDAGRRAVALGPQVIRALQTVRDEQAEQKRLLGPEYCDRDLIFAQPNGKPLWGCHVTHRVLRRLCERTGIPRLTFHQLRHLHASYLALAGVPLRVAQERLGHSSARITQEIYQHTLAGQQHEAARAVETRLFGEMSFDRDAGEARQA